MSGRQGVSKSLSLKKDGLKRLWRISYWGWIFFRRRLKKAMSPGHKRQLALGFVAQGRCSGRQVCRYFKLLRSTYRYQEKEMDAWRKISSEGCEALFIETPTLRIS